MLDKIILKYNSAVLIFGNDDELKDYLHTCMDAYSNIYATVNEYIASGIPSNTIASAWNEVEKNYGIKQYDYIALLSNQELSKCFIKLCKNEHTDKIKNNISEYQTLVLKEEFDGIFRKYVEIEIS